MLLQSENIKTKETLAREYIDAAFHKSKRQRFLFDKFIVGVLFLCACIVILFLFNILVHLVGQGISSVNINFFTQLPKPVGEVGGGMANAIVGTIILLSLALVVGIPIGVGSGIYLSEYAGTPLAQAVRFTIDVMNGIPSIVFGIFVYTILVLPLKTFSALSGGIALGVMMVPMITRTTDGIIRMIPGTLREAALALGAPKWKMIVDIVVPSALGGIVTGVMIALARVAGETAPLLFTAFGNRFWHSSLLEPIAALPLQIFAYAISPFEDWHAQAWAGALVLIFLVFVINLTANYFVFKQQKTLGKG